jgi:hypothetical protein
MRDGKIGFGINIRDPQHWFCVSLFAFLNIFIPFFSLVSLLMDGENKKLLSLFFAQGRVSVRI